MGIMQTSGQESPHWPCEVCEANGATMVIRGGIDVCQECYAELSRGENVARSRRLRGHLRSNLTPYNTSTDNGV